MTTATETAQSERFRFGENWQSFLRTVDDKEIRLAEASMRRLLQRETLDGVRFLDIGCGSGLLFAFGAKPGGHRPLVRFRWPGRRMRSHAQGQVLAGRRAMDDRAGTRSSMTRNSSGSALSTSSMPGASCTIPARCAGRSANAALSSLRRGARDRALPQDRPLPVLDRRKAVVRKRLAVGATGRAVDLCHRHARGLPREVAQLPPVRR